jgi:UDP-N-acetylmuramate dehydrogenase
MLRVYRAALSKSTAFSSITESVSCLMLTFAMKKNIPLLTLGGGTNMLVSDDGFEGLVLKIETKGLTFEEQKDFVKIIAQAGESWDGLVATAVQKGLWGIENLSHIPGTVGAFVIQNVGAYGQEASQVVESVEVFDTLTNTIGTVSKEDCYFSYRTSVFNSVMKGRFIVLSVRIILSKESNPNMQYTDVHKYFNPGCDVQDHEHGHENFSPSIEEIRHAIIQIRDKKFTLPSVIPNSGSFFKNLLLSPEEYEVLEENIKNNFDETALTKLQGYKNRLTRSSLIKIPTAFLIDLCELKGKTVGGAKVNESQPLVIINFTGSATAIDVLALMQIVRQTVYKKTGMELKPEPELIGFSEETLHYYFKL